MSEEEPKELEEYEHIALVAKHAKSLLMEWNETMENYAIKNGLVNDARLLIDVVMSAAANMNLFLAGLAQDLGVTDLKLADSKTIKKSLEIVELEKKMRDDK